ncbi:MAG: YbhB/YbcL family Raf kinase inhibitor-like protein [Gemmatimonadetes bacterium]|nr:YbhB/YbcL family Raf kinase inhibitor-like protein [Gemmatimonadota bacterium]
MFTLESASFAPGGDIPSRHTCDGIDSSPPLHWRDPPPGTRSFVLIVDDPDAPDPAAPIRVWVHWLLYDIPASCTSLAEGIEHKGLPSGTRVGVNDSGDAHWGGPCPPIGRHRYFFTLYALVDTLPDLGPRVHRADLDKAMHGHVLAQAQLMGHYGHTK